VIAITSVYKIAGDHYRSADHESRDGLVSVLDKIVAVVDCYGRQNDPGSDRAGVHSDHVPSRVCGHADRQNDRDRNCVRDIERMRSLATIVQP
jgi:hypothetical protein